MICSLDRETNGRRAGERGSILALSAIGMLAFLLAVGLAVDVSHFYLVQTELQNAADAAALSGASALNSAESGITEAVNRAVVTMNNREFNRTGVTIPRANVEFAINLGGPYMSEAEARDEARDIRFVRVQVPPAAVNVFFAAPVLGNATNIDAEAVAGNSVSLNVLCDIIPLSAVDDEANPMSPGNLYTVRLPPGNHIGPGNYQILAIDGPGGSDVRAGIAAGVKNCFSAGDMVSTKPGVSAGAVRQGINTRFDEYDGPVNPTDHPPDTNIREGITYAQYRDGTATQAPANAGVDKRRVVIIPIIRASEFDNGRDSVRIDRFGAFFLREKVPNGSGGDIQAEYIGDGISTGRGSYDPTIAEGPTPSITKPVLYR